MVVGEGHKNALVLDPLALGLDALALQWQHS